MAKNKVITPKGKFEIKEVGLKLKDAKKSEVAKIKAESFSEKTISNFSRDGILVEIVKQPYVLEGMLAVNIRAYKDNRELFIDNPLLYKNPPIMVPDGTFFEHDTPFGKMELPNFVEDLEEALRTMIIETIKILNK